MGSSTCSFPFCDWHICKSIIDVLLQIIFNDDKEQLKLIKGLGLKSLLFLKKE